MYRLFEYSKNFIIKLNPNNNSLTLTMMKSLIKFYYVLINLYKIMQFWVKGHSNYLKFMAQKVNQI